MSATITPIAVAKVSALSVVSWPPEEVPVEHP